MFLDLRYLSALRGRFKRAEIRYSERILSDTDSIALQILDFGGPRAELCVDRLSSDEEAFS